MAWKPPACLEPKLRVAGADDAEQDDVDSASRCSLGPSVAESGCSWWAAYRSTPSFISTRLTSGRMRGAAPQNGEGVCGL